MIEQIPDLPENVVGFTAKGTVTAKDYETTIIPAVEAAFAGHTKLRFLYHLGEGFEGFEAGAMWDDAKLGLQHLKGWERVAVVSDVEWIKVSMRAFALAIPGHVRVFANHELDSARQWVSGS